MSTLLSIGHPGHELRLMHWLGEKRPHCAVLTDGSGSSEIARTESTRRLLLEQGCTISPYFGRFKDKEIYQRILSIDVAFFWERVLELVQELKDHAAKALVGDMSEGYNSTHDIMNVLNRCATIVYQKSKKVNLEQWEFALEADPSQVPPGNPKAWPIVLTDEELVKKIAAARGYPELAFEVERAERLGGLERFRLECLYQVTGNGLNDDYLNEPPYYEIYGRQQIKKGTYSDLITYEHHVRSLSLALLERATA